MSERDTIGDLERLAALRDRGALSEAEYEAQKAVLLGAPPEADRGPLAEPPATPPAPALTRDQIGCLALLAIGAVVLLLSQCIGARPSVNEASAPADLRQLYRVYAAAAERCDGPNKRVADVVKGGGGPVLALASAQRSRDACRATWLEIGKLEAPESLSQERADEVDAVIADCKNAYYVRTEAIKAFITMLDGGRPAQVATWSNTVRNSDNGLLRCVSGFARVGRANGVDLLGAQR